jgi:hypothetical protein
MKSNTYNRNGNGFSENGIGYNNDGFYPPSLNNILRQEEYIKDGLRSPETYFRLKDVPPEKRRYWRRLKRRDEGWYSDNGKRTWIAKRMEISAVVSKLGIPKYQKKMIVALSMKENASEYNHYGGRPSLALAVAVYVVNRERQQYEHFEYEDRIEEDECFKGLVERNDIDIVPAKKKYKKKMWEWNNSS